MTVLRIAVWWARDYIYASWWQVRAFFDRTDPAKYRDGDRTTLVVVPGIYETWRFLQPLIVALHERGHPVHVVESLGRNQRPVVGSAEDVHRYLEAHNLTDVILVAHSKGGLIGKQAMVNTPSARRIRGMVAVATPFQGSIYGRVMLIPALRAFGPRDPTILALTTAAQRNDQVVSIYGRFDPHIPGGSELPGARNVRLDTGGHFRILAHPRVAAEIERLSDHTITESA
jgi:pimeloyl-ACP methyl ester carboxylesterase